MKTTFQRFCAICAVLVAMPGAQAWAQADIGAAASVVNQITGERPGSNRRLTIGDRVYQNEAISTASDARGQILFRDETALTLGPDTRVTLDRFVYNPGGQSSVGINAAKGVFRFVSGNLPSNSYNVGTPVGTIGVRGTIIDFILDGGALVAQLINGEFEFRMPNGQTALLRNVGDVLEVGLDGKITISSKLTNAQRSQLAVIRDLLDRSDLLDNPGRNRVRDVVLRRNQQPGSSNPGRPGGGGPGGPGDGG